MEYREDQQVVMYKYTIRKSFATMFHMSVYEPILLKYLFITQKEPLQGFICLWLTSRVHMYVYIQNLEPVNVLCFRV